MKLKKIVSLALAGILAVSMLAGCSNTPANPDDGDQNVEVTTSGVSADVKARIEDNDFDIPEYVTFKDSADLDADLKYAVQFAGVPEVLAGNIFFNRQLQAVTNNNLVTELDEAVDATAGETIFNIGANDTLLGVEINAGQSVKLDDAVAVQAYVVSNEIGDDARNEMIAWAIQDAVSSYQYTVEKNYLPFEQAGGNFNFSYEVSVSVCDVTHSSTIIGNVGAENPDVTFVAIQVVRTSTHQ
ncbi:hypothetical protein [Faecalibacterium sp. An192]|uniref:hypothetical protein n=1 Tax=Faecalibacterium sp. An192 TaxID=1965581 RepID=UPI000B37E11C|nr:hypothetical protein [Faecalibacterium sp. An192]OUP26226.1 hypothetical protein B5F27_14280 [Faecalibacterium sp. An192]